MKISKYKYLVISILFWGFYVVSVSDVKAHDKEIAITTNSAEAYNWFIEGRETMENYRFNDSRILFARALTKDPHFAQAHLYLALSAPTVTEFLSHLQQAIINKNNVSYGERLMIEAIQSLANDDLNTSISIWQKLVREYPEDKRAHQFIGITYMKASQYVLAIDQFKKAIAIDKSYAPAYNFIGYAYRSSGDYSRAEDAFKKYIEFLPKEANPYNSIADLYTKIGRNQEAIGYYQIAIQMNPNFDSSHQKMGTYLVFMSKYEEGRTAYQKAIALATHAADRINHMKMIAYSYLYEAKYDKAIAAFDKALQMSKEVKLPEISAELHSEKCDINLFLVELGEAKRNMENCGQDVLLSDLPAQVKAFYEKKVLFREAYISIKSKDFKSASKYIDQYYRKIIKEDNPDDFENINALNGFYNFEKGDFNLAIADFNQANQDDPIILYYLAMSYMKTGEVTGASIYFNKTANINENSLQYALIKSKAQIVLKNL